MAACQASGPISSRPAESIGLTASITLAIPRPRSPLGARGSPVWCSSSSPDAVALHVSGAPRGAAGGWRESSPPLSSCSPGMSGKASSTCVRHYLGTPPRGTPSTWTILQHSIGKVDGLVRQMIAVFGWIDIPAPSLTFAVWFLVICVWTGLAILVLSCPWALGAHLGDRIDPGASRAPRRLAGA